MKISTSLNITRFMFIISLILIIGYNIVMQRQIIREINEIATVDIEVSETLTSITIEQLENAIFIESSIKKLYEKREIPIEKLSSDFNKFKNNIKTQFAYLHRVLAQNNNKTIMIEEYASIVNDLIIIEALFEEYILSTDTLISFYNIRNIDEIISMEPQYEKLEKELDYKLESLLFKIESFTKDSVLLVKQHEKLIYYSNTIIFSILVLILIIMSEIIIKRVIKSINSLVEFIDKIEYGKRDFGRKKPFKNELDRIVIKLEELITTVSKDEKKLSHLSGTDKLTKIPTRLRFMNTLATLQEHEDKTYLILFDINQFKRINDNKGIDFGNKILVSVSRILENYVKNHEFISRWAGDKFMIFIKDSDDNIIEEIIEKINSDVIALGTEFNISLTLNSSSVEWQAGTTLQDIINQVEESLRLVKTSVNVS